MGKKRKEAPLVPPPIASRRVARRVTSEFHRLAQDAARAPTRAAREAAARALEASRGRYQEASALSTALYSTSRWVLRVLRRRGVLTLPQARAPALLEVGAVNTQLLDARGLAVRAIDIRSSLERIERRDFFDLDPAGAYDVVVCSLVINQLPEALARGRMVAGLVAHLRPGGLCFLVVPRSCLERSLATTPARFDAVLRRAGFVELERRATPRLLHLCLAAGGAGGGEVAPEHRLRVRRKKANDFAVSLPAA
jgi:25S rRNA (adenine2142-N1)-methyltransferase